MCDYLLFFILLSTLTKRKTSQWKIGVIPISSSYNLGPCTLTIIPSFILNPSDCDYFLAIYTACWLIVMCLYLLQILWYALITALRSTILFNSMQSKRFKKSNCKISHKPCSTSNRFACDNDVSQRWTIFIWIENW